MRLVRSIVTRFHGAGRDAEDLFQLGCLGLVKAIDRFDLSFPVRFSTYAVPMIMGEIRRYLRDDGPLRVSRALKGLAAACNRERENLTRSLGREPSLQEVAAAVGATVEDVVEALEGARPPASFQETIYTGDGEPILLEDQVAATTVCETDWFEHMAVREGLRRLSRRERQVLELRYFRDRTQTEVARCLGISQVQVSRIERRALLRIRDYLNL